MKKLWLNNLRATVVAVLLIFSAIAACTQAAVAQNPVKNIVLVHGAFADGSGWEGVYQILRKKGYNVSVVANPNTGLAEDVAAVKLVLARQTGPVILVGHSYGGAIITEAGNEPVVTGLVYISAFVPDAGESLLSLLKAGPPNPHAGILPPENGYLWFDKAKYHQGFCADLSVEKAAFMADSQVPVSASVFASTISVAAWKSKPSWYLVATDDHVIPAEAARFMAKRAGAKISEVKSSHVSYVSQPAAVAKIIEDAARGAGK